MEWIKYIKFSIKKGLRITNDFDSTPSYKLVSAQSDPTRLGNPSVLSRLPSIVDCRCGGIHLTEISTYLVKKTHLRSSLRNDLIQLHSVHCTSTTLLWVAMHGNTLLRIWSYNMTQGTTAIPITINTSNIIKYLKF